MVKIISDGFNITLSHTYKCLVLLDVFYYNRRILQWGPSKKTTTTTSENDVLPVCHCQTTFLDEATLKHTVILTVCYMYTSFKQSLKYVCQDT